MKKIIFLIAIFLSTLIVNSQCIYEVCLTDDYGDGWNGNTIDVFVNGALVATYGPAFTTGSGPVCYDVPVNLGDDIDIIFNPIGSWTSECHFTLTDSQGTLVGSGSVSANINNVIANCPPPPCGPTSVTPDPQVIMNCGGGQDTINFTINGGCTGNYEYQILDGATVIQPWSTTSVYYASPPTTTTFTIEVRCDVCPGIIVSDTFLIEVIPAPTITGNTTLCAGDFTTLTATGLLGNYEWWSDQIGGNLLDTTGVYTTPPLTTTTTYWTQTTGQTSTVGTILITESGLEGFMGGSGSEDYLEISNLYSTTINTTGWVAAVSDSYSDINSVNSILWQLPSSFTACSVVWRCDDSGYPANYWGNNIFWNGTSQSWSIIIDDVGNVVDFCVWGWSAAEIASMNTTINGFNITIGPEWIGNGAILPCSGVNTSLQRIGNTDTNTEIDWICQTSTVDIVNPGLSCGWMPVSCRFPTTVTVLPDLIVDSIFTNPLCCGSFDGTGGILNMTTGTGPYTYLWSNTDTTQNITGLNAGTYTVIVTDDMGCTGSTSITIIDPILLTITSTNTPETCGLSDGSVTIIVNGGTPPLLYDIGSGQVSTNVFDSLSAGPYIITITDDNGCTETEIVTVGATGNVISGFITNPNQCLNGNSFDFTNTGDTGGIIHWTWSFPGGSILNDTTENPTGITWNTPGIYSITQTAILNSCNDVTIFDIEIFEEPTATISTTNITCFGFCDGDATVTVNGGTPNYTYFWNDSQTTQTAINLCDGDINVTVTDSNGCTDSITSTIYENTILTVNSISSTNVDCFGNNNGTITITGSGGLPPLTYNIGIVTNLSGCFFGLSANTYDVLITDLNGCTIISPIIINEPPEIIINTQSSTNITCYGYNNGNININASGGVQPLTYSINGTSQSTGNFNNLTPGMYTIIITDLNDCSITTNFTIDEPTEIIISMTPDHTICNGQSTNISVSSIGGILPFNYVWSNTSTTINNIDVSPIIETTYVVHIEDANGCLSNYVSTTIGVSTSVQLSIFSNTDYVCPGEPATINISPSLGVPPYTILINNNNESSPYITYPSQTTTYNFTVTDNCGSTATQSYTINVYDKPTISMSSNIMSGCQPLTVNFLEISLDSNQTYVWDFGDNFSYSNSPTYTFEDYGVYDISLTVTSSEGCSNTNTITNMITVYPLPTAKFIVDNEIVNIINPTIYINNMSLLNVTNYWIFGDGKYSTIVNPIHVYPYYSGTYILQLIVTTNHDCRDTIYTDIQVQDQYTFYAPTAFSPDNDGINDYFRVYGKNINNDFNLLIYDRWGEMIFESFDIKETWDGKINDYVKNGVYAWYCIFKDHLGVEHVEVGAVTVIR